jgi:hypothetical protein
MGHADEGHRSDGLDDRAPLRNRVRKTRTQQAALEADDRPFRAAEAERAATEFVLKKTAMSDEGAPPVPRFTVITLGVDDIKASIAFYGALG